MDRILPRAAMALLTLGVPALVAAQGRSFTDRTVPGMQQADRHNPFSRNYTDMTPGGYARRQSGGYRRGGHSYSFGYPSLYGYYGPGHYGPSYYDPGPGYYDYGPSYYGGPWGFDDGYGYPPLPAYPLTIPSETMFGLGALWNRLGVAPPAVTPPAHNIIVVPPQKKAAQAPRPVNAETLARAGRFLSAGDDHFAAQRYRDANQRYRSATEAAPELVEAYFRQGQALVAMGQYDLAIKAFQRGLKIGPLWKDAEFSLTDLYGQNQLAKTAHLEALAAAASDEPHNGDLLLLVGLQLHFDGQSERAQPFLQKAAALLADQSLHLNSVLKPAGDSDR